MKKLFAISMTCLLTCLLVLPVRAESTTESPVIPTLGNGDGLLVDGLALFLVAVILFAVIVSFTAFWGQKIKSRALRSKRIENSLDKQKGMDAVHSLL